MSNKRFISRQHRRLPVTLGGEGRRHTFTADVSPGGFCAEMMHVPHPGSVVHGTLLLGTDAFSFTGEVTWAHAGDPRLSLRGRVGVRFTGISNDFFSTYLAAFPDQAR